VPLPSCPQAPTITQGILQLASWSLVPNEMISAVNHIPIGQRVNAGNPSIPPVGPTPEPITAFPVTGPTLSTLLPNLTPLAFISSSPGPAAATQLYNTSADVFLYGVASLSNSSGQDVQPDTLYLLYDDTSRTNANLQQGATVAEFSLPLVVFNPSTTTETLVPTTLQFKATNAGDCTASTVSGQSLDSPPSISFSSLLASKIGINCAVVFAPSPLSAKSHAIFELAVPLVVTMATDPLYFFNPISNLEPVGFSFKSDETGFTPQAAILGGNSIGIGPAAVPLCTGSSCPPPTPPAPASALCANLPTGNDNGQAPVPSVAAFYAISTVGETLLSAAVPSASTSACPF